MKKGILLTLATMLWPAFSFAQTDNCDAIVYDEAKVLSDATKITAAANQLNAQGADVRVRTVAHTGNLDFDENQYLRNCTSWQSAGDHTTLKNTLIVLMIAPNDRKMGLYYGGAWHHALDDHWNRIKQDYMAPRFRDKDWAGGILAAEQQLTARLAASKSEALTPTTHIVQEQPTDFSGLWTAIKWIVALVAIGLAIFGLVLLIRSRKDDEEEVSGEQQHAVLIRNRCGTLLANLRNEDHAKYLAFVERYSQLSNSEKLNPDTPGLSASAYRNISEEWESLYDDMNAKSSSVVGDVPPTPTFPVRKTTHDVKKTTAPEEKKTEEKASTSNTTVVAPIIVDNSVHEDYSPPPEKHHSSWADSGGSSWSGGSSRRDDDDSGGGSSSWGGGDSGGGGSSDFGGGGDSGSSGGGGSSDF